MKSDFAVWRYKPTQDNIAQKGKQSIQDLKSVSAPNTKTSLDVFVTVFVILMIIGLIILMLTGI